MSTLVYAIGGGLVLATFGAVWVARRFLDRVDAWHDHINTLPPDAAIAEYDSPPLSVRIFRRMDRTLQPPERLTYECPNCCRVAEWTDGTTTAAGDDRNEFWCQTCGAETPLEDCRPVAVSRRRRMTRRGTR